MGRADARNMFDEVGLMENTDDRDRKRSTSGTRRP